jgi:uncharacterized membrane protein
MTAKANGGGECQSESNDKESGDLMEPNVQGVAPPNQLDELTNDIVTVSKLQIALKARAKALQAQLTEISIHTDTASSESLFELLQQAATALLDHATFWTHVLVASETVCNREDAELLFSQWSIQERSKFSVESLSNVQGVLTQQDVPLPPPDETPEYIVVTLLLGTADDQPLFKEVYSAPALRDILEDIRMMSPRSLLVLEVLWSPQTASDSLTQAELETEYPELVAIS